MKDEFLIHITPESCYADIDEMPDSEDNRSRSKHYIKASGRHEINQVNEANYFVGTKVPYHEHKTAYETFLVEKGAIEVLTRSRKAVARKGELIHIQPYVPHSIKPLEDDSTIRAYHHGHSLLEDQMDNRRFRETYPELAKSPDIRQQIAPREQTSIWFDYEVPQFMDVPVNEFPEIRTFGESLAEFNFDKLNLKLKIGRWEMGGVKEIWQLHMKAGCSFSWVPTNIFNLLYDVYDGSVEVRPDGMDPFVANTRDMIHVPRYLGGSITALKDTVLFDIGCQGYMMQYLDEVNSIKASAPEKLQDEECLRRLMKKYDFYVRYQLG